MRFHYHYNYSVFKDNNYLDISHFILIIPSRNYYIRPNNIEEWKPCVLWSPVYVAFPIMRWWGFSNPYSNLIQRLLNS